MYCRESSESLPSKMQAPLALLLTTLLAVSISAIPINSYVPSSDGRLHIIRVADNSLEAIFYNAGAGIRIIASSLSLSLYSMDGEELLLSGDKPHGSSLFATVMGHSFLEYNTTLEDGTQKTVDYAVPDSLAEQAKEAVESAKMERMLSQLSDMGTEQAIETAFQDLLLRPEIALIESAAIALGQAGVMGYENQGALNFYMVAKALIKARGREEVVGGEEGSEIEEDTYTDNAGGRQKREYKYCSNNGENCEKCPIGDDCLGECGPGCNNCWSYVCGTCCYYQGCYDHDVCCDTYFKLACDLPIGFSCSGYYCWW